jgi:digeranylgeranylglycerophospholipid reductase
VESWDVLVVGAGPGGSTAARHAAKSGCRTLLIEKRAEIGVPVRCGEGIASGWLAELGIPPDSDILVHAAEGVRVFAPDGSCLVLGTSTAGGKVGYTIDRTRFDQHLAAEAARAGAEVRIRTSAVGLLTEAGNVRGVRCEHMGRTDDVRADIVIGADGFESLVGRWAGLETRLRARDVDACLEYTMVGVEGDPRYDDFHIGSCAPGGRAWVLWKGEDVANVGVGVNLSRVGDRAEAKAYLDRFVRNHAGLARGQVIQEIAGAVSASLPLERTVADGLILVGDAARFVDPLTGGGIRNACLSGRFAGEVAGEAVAAGDVSASFLAHYERRWRDRLGEALARNHRVKGKLLDMDDKAIGRIIRALAAIHPDGGDATGILGRLREQEPDLAAALGLA